MLLYQNTPLKPSGDTRDRLQNDGNFIGGMLILLMVFLTFGFTVIALLFTLTGHLTPADLAADDLNLGNTGFLLFYMGVYALSMGLPSALGVILFRRSPRRLIDHQPVSFKVAISGILIGFTGCVAANMAANYVAQILDQFGITAPEPPVTIQPTLTSLVLNLVVLAVLPAILEELLFRGLILHTLRPYGERLAVVLTAILFGFIHGGITQSVFAFLVGLVLGWLTVTTRNIWPAIVLHFINNALSVLLQYAGLGLDDTHSAILNVLVMYGLAAVGVMVLVLCIRRRVPFLRLPSHGKLSAVSCAGSLWKTPLMIIALILGVLRMLKMIFF